MTDYPKAQWIPNNNFFPDSGKKRKIVIHGTAGGTSATGIADYFKSTEGTTNPVSTHYIVDQAGAVVQCVLEKDGAWGQGVVTNPAYDGENPNNYCIGIEFVKSSTDNSDLVTADQMVAGVSLIEDICKRNGLTFSDIIPHSAIDPVNRSRCPGPFPWDVLKMQLAPIPTGYQQKAADTQWGSIVKAPVGTGIYKSWLAAYISGIFYGPALSLEFPSNDWNGNPIIVQEFAYAWCEWLNGTPTWYARGGKL